MSFLNQLRTCCGYFCGASACVGIYFFIVLCVFEKMNNTYMTEELQKMSNPLDDQDSVNRFALAFGMVAIVSVIFYVYECYI